MDEKTLAELKELLLKEKASLENDLGKIASPVNKGKGDYETSFEDMGSGEDENASEVEAYTDNLPVEASLEKKLQDVNAALERITAGTYGFCENCQQEIPLERLRVNPSAKNCVKCL